MATQPNTPILIPKKSQLAIAEFFKQCYQLTGQQWNLRENMRSIDLAYMREQDMTIANQRAKLANKLGDADRFQNIEIPVIAPAVEEAVVYQSSVFLTGNPLFGVVSDPANIDAALQLETTIDNQAVRGGWTQELMMFFRDGFKYNLSALECTWRNETVASLETDLAFTGGKQAKPKEIIWSGNYLKRRDPYNTFWDTRVDPVDIPYYGEFAGYMELMSRIRLKQFIAELGDEKMIENIKEAFESGFTGGGPVGDLGAYSYYLPQLNPGALVNRQLYPATNWLSWAGLAKDNARGFEIDYKDNYLVSTLYGRILPSDFNLRVPSANTPQIWKFILVNNNVLIYAERQTNAHNLIPILFGQPKNDGLGYQTKSFAEDQRPIQNLSTALMNSVVAARRRAISDRGIYDPSRITEANINSANPSAKIPVRPSAFGKPISEAYYPIPFRDENSGQILQMIPMIGSFGQTMSGQNKARQGQFTKGNRTKHEFQSIMGNAVGKDQCTSLLYEAQIFTPLKGMLKSNILQYQGSGDIYSRDKKQIVSIDPIVLRQTILAFKISDGLLPSDKLLNADAFTAGVQQIATSPQLAAGYNLAPAFSYLMKTQGADLSPFEKSPEQVAFEQASARWQQMAQLALEKGIEFKIPQPVPQQFNYNPAQQGAQAGAPPEVRNTVQNITQNKTVNS